jgi:hypothetical protein
MEDRQRVTSVVTIALGYDLRVFKHLTGVNYEENDASECAHSIGATFHVSIYYVSTN